MAYESKDQSGALFKNDKKTTANQPDYRGDCVVNGTPMWISAWIKEGQRGKFMSLSFQPKEASGEEDQTRQPQRQQPKPQASKPQGRQQNLEPEEELEVPF